MTTETQKTPPPIKPSSARWMMRWRKWLKPFMSRHGAPEDIARGLAIGFFIAFTPTIGIQLILAYFIATALKASRAAALLPVWITMPITIPPVFAFTYTVGRLFVDGPSVNHVRGQLVQLVRRMDGVDTFDIATKFRMAMDIGHDVFIPMLIGGLIVGVLCAAVAYPVALWGVRRFRAHREKKRANRRHCYKFRIKRRGAAPRNDPPPADAP